MTPNRKGEILALIGAGLVVLWWLVAMTIGAAWVFLGGD